jgi:hypothetical protein
LAALVADGTLTEGTSNNHLAHKILDACSLPVRLSAVQGAESHARYPTPDSLPSHEVRTMILFVQIKATRGEIRRDGQ